MSGRDALSRLQRHMQMLQEAEQAKLETINPRLIAIIDRRIEGLKHVIADIQTQLVNEEP